MGAEKGGFSLQSRQGSLIIANKTSLTSFLQPTERLSLTITYGLYLWRVRLQILVQAEPKSIVCVCVCVGIYFDVYASKYVPGGEQEVGLATRTLRITDTPSYLENTRKKIEIYMEYKYTHTPYIYNPHIYIPYTHTHTNKEKICMCVCVYMYACIHFF